MSSKPPESRGNVDRAPLVRKGIAGSAGLGIGKAVVLDTRRAGVVRRHIKKHQADDEMERFAVAVEQGIRSLRDVADGAHRRVGRAEASILEAYILMLEDDALREEVERHVKIDLLCAEWAVDKVTTEMAEHLRRAGDPYLAERSHDFEFIGDVLKRAFLGPGQLGLPAITEPSILVSHDLSPAETAALDKDRVLGLVTEVGTRTSHTAILARSLEIPAVVGVTGILEEVGNEDVLIVDGYRGAVTLWPSEEAISEASARAARHRALARDLHAGRDRPCMTKCGTLIDIRANIELPSDADLAIHEGAQGIGLYRTEFLYVDRASPPSEEEQYAVYRRVVEKLLPQPVTVRTFDIGGDKFVSTFQAPPEMNPALGLRAVRLALAQPDLFLAQLRAMVRSSAHGSLRILVPMIASVQEFKAVRSLLDRAIAEVDAARQPRAERIPLGVMVEVPSAAIMAHELAEIAEFLSIGTNDLIQYALAVDRTNRELAWMASPFDPAILRLIRTVVEAGERKARPVSVCGAMASDPIAAVLLVGMGLRELSLEASSIPQVKEAIARVTLREAEALALDTLGLTTAQEIERAVAEALAPRLADLLESEETA